MNIKRYRKEPVIVEAVQFTNAHDYFEIYKWVYEMGGNCSGLTKPDSRARDKEFQLLTCDSWKTVRIDDWVIRDSSGEFCVCRPYTFKKTYEEEDNYD